MSRYRNLYLTPDDAQRLYDYLSYCVLDPDDDDEGDIIILRGKIRAYLRGLAARVDEIVAQEMEYARRLRDVADTTTLISSNHE